MAWAPRVIVAAIVLVAAAAPVSAERRTTILTVVLNEVNAGEHIVYLEDGDALVPVDAMRAVGLELHGVPERIDGIGYVSVRSLSVPFTIDEEQMTLRVTARPGDLPATRIDLAAHHAPAGMQSRADTSVYVNYGAHAVGTSLDGFAELGARHGATLGYTSVAVLPDHAVIRGLSNITLDDRAGRQRWIVGDAVVQGGPLGGGGVIGGLHLARSFDLDPYAVLTPAIDLTGSVLAPSTADIYVNGVLVRREQLAPGRYTLANLPVSTGAGQARVVLRDALGRQQELTTGFYVPGGLLRPGVSDYHLALGAERDRMGLSSFDYGDAIAIARYQRGLTSRLTAGVRADLTIEQRGAGSFLVAGLPFGQVDLAAGVSADRGQVGTAVSAGWSYLSRRGAVSISGRRVSTHYATVDVDRDADRAVLEARLQASLSLGRGIGVSAQASVIDFRDRDSSNRMALHVTSTPGRGATLAMTVGRSAESQEPPSYDAMVTLSLAVSTRTRGSVTHRHNNGDRTQAEIHSSLGGERGLGYRALAELGDHDRAVASVQAQTSFGRYEVGYTYVGQGSGSLEVSAAGGLALIGGRVFASTPIDRSFALVRVPGNAGVEASLENHPVGRTDARGDLFVPNLTPYYGNNLSIDPRDLPLDRKLPVTRQIIAPAAGGGVIVVFEAPALHIVRGTLRVGGQNGTQAPAYGVLSVAGTSSAFVSPVGSDGAFELEGVLAGRHAASVDWQGGHCVFELVVPARTAEPIVDVGELVCATTARAARP